MTNSVPYVSSELLDKVRKKADKKYSAKLTGKKNDLGMVILQCLKVMFERKGEDITAQLRHFVLFDHSLNKIGVVKLGEIVDLKIPSIPNDHKIVKTPNNVLYMSNTLFDRFTAIASKNWGISREPFKDIGMLTIENYKVEYTKRGQPVASDAIDFIVHDQTGKQLGVIKRRQIQNYYPKAKSKTG